MASGNVWLAAEYHFPSTYSIRIPGSSMANAKVLPAPGPATVRLALIRTGIEIFGFEKVETDLFPVIRAADIWISPPEKVAISTQTIRAYKAVKDKVGKTQYQETVSYREFAQSQGNMTIFISVPREQEDRFVWLLYGIGYWGQASSLTTCVNISSQQPDMHYVALPLESINRAVPDQYSCIVTEFRSTDLSWRDVLPEKNGIDLLKSMLYVWPLKICERRQGKTLLLGLSQTD